MVILGEQGQRLPDPREHQGPCLLVTADTCTAGSSGRCWGRNGWVPGAEAKHVAGSTDTLAMSVGSGFRLLSPIKREVQVQPASGGTAALP